MTNTFKVPLGEPVYAIEHYDNVDNLAWTPVVSHYDLLYRKTLEDQTTLQARVYIDQIEYTRLAELLISKGKRSAVKFMQIPHHLEGQELRQFVEKALMAYKYEFTTSNIAIT